MPYATSDGVRIHYHVEGNAAGPPLVVQQGFSLSMREW